MEQSILVRSELVLILFFLKQNYLFFIFVIKPHTHHRKKWNRLGKNRCERHSAMVARGDQSGTEAKPNESRCKWLQ